MNVWVCVTNLYYCSSIDACVLNYRCVCDVPSFFYLSANLAFLIG
jgi:hypothetical protein